MDAATLQKQQDDYTTAFNMLAPPPKPKPDDPLPHYPSQRYIDQNLAPEKTLTYQDVAALGQARREAEKAGVLTPELGAHLLPMAMVEGHSGNFGVKMDSGYYAKPATLARFKNMGLSVTDLTDPNEVAARQWDISKNDASGVQRYYRRVTGPNGAPAATVDPQGNYIKPILREVPVPPIGDLTLGPAQDGKGKMVYFGVPSSVHPSIAMGAEQPGDSTLRYARIMAAVLADKAATTGSNLTDDAVKRYNGVGTAIEHDAGQDIPANVDTYLAKVKSAKSMLEHPYNKAIVDHFNSAYKAK